MKVLVFGGTGTVGSAVVTALLQKGHTPKVLTRSAEKAGSLAVEASVGDLAKPATLGPALQDAEGVFLLVPIGSAETEQGLAAVEAVKNASGVKRLVYLSVVMPPGSEVIPHFASKLPVERAVQASGVPWLVLRPNNFFQNDVRFRDALQQHGVYPAPLGSRGLNRVDVRDIADAAVSAFTKTGIEGIVPLNGPRGLTGDDTARVYAEQLRRPVTYIGDDLEAWGRQAAGTMPPWMVDDLKIMYRVFQEQGAHASGSDFAAQQRLLGRAPRPFENFVAELVASWRSAPGNPE